ncbi:MAG: hypothetical protein ACM3UR_09230 [Bacteroidota bacterium]|jgi:hypothetical protein|nr:hypothetical protein [Ignavibacteria bacterium]MCU7497974.1 hypothetical protein [Ignavibacteria bacterium]MCU7511740.1 hypothetical protein [Ignavibacteria bacterium]MCU7519814.1 hypothetical protein [Ignavibacteria bacterium]MCU7523688.1 hypothetical protein [Ignavibacteria bacterium]
MKETIKEILSKADEKYRLRYLLGKDDIDDIQAAIVVLRESLMKEFPGLIIRSRLDKIKLESQTDEYYTIMVIQLIPEHLILQYNEFGALELFNSRSECDMKLIGEVKSVLKSLGFYQTGESRGQEDRYDWHFETYKIDVIRRKI